LFPVAVVKCILGYRLARVRTSLLWCILRKVGGSSHIRTFWPCFARSKLWIGTCTRAATDDVSRVHKYREVRTRTQIEKGLKTSARATSGLAYSSSPHDSGRGSHPQPSVTGLWITLKLKGCKARYHRVIRALVSFMRWSHWSGFGPTRGWISVPGGSSAGSRPPTGWPGTPSPTCCSCPPSLIASGWCTARGGQPPLPTGTTRGPQPSVRCVSLQSKREREVRCVKEWFPTESLLYLLKHQLALLRLNSVLYEVCASWQERTHQRTALATGQCLFSGSGDGIWLPDNFELKKKKSPPAPQ